MIVSELINALSEIPLDVDVHVAATEVYGPLGGLTVQDGKLVLCSKETLDNIAKSKSETDSN